MRLFLDSNVLFLVGYSDSSPVHKLLGFSRRGRCVLVASGYAVEEARRNLAAKGPEDALARLDAALPFVTLVAEAGPAEVERATSARLSDPADVPILAAALQSRADVLVTGDLRAFGPHFGSRLCGVEVLRLRDALRRILELPAQ